MANPLRVRFTVLTCPECLFLTFTHRDRGVTSVLVDHDGVWPTGIAVIGDRGAEQLEVLGDDYFEAVVEMVADLLVRAAA